jgi:D-3-phosphoglycerate dehydrogenase
MSINTKERVAVCSRSFSKHPLLRAELLKRYAQVTFNDAGVQYSGDSLVGFLSGHDKAITALEPIDESVLSRLPDLKVIGKYGVGLDMIDLDAMRRYGVHLGYTGGVNRRSVSELTIAFAISLLRHLPQANNEVRSGNWRQHVGRQLSNCTVGIVGCGHIGKDLVKLLQPFGCKILIHDVQEYPEFYAAHQLAVVELNRLLIESDIVTLHVPLDHSTQGLISAACIGAMKPTAILINAARGGLVDEIALKKALIEKKLAAAAFDVFSIEPPQDTELLNLPNFFATPHIGGSAEEAILAMGMSAIDGLDQFADSDTNA